MKVFVFVRGHESDLKSAFVNELVSRLTPGSYMKINLNDFDPVDRKNAHKLSKDAVKTALKWDSPHCFVITNPSLNPPDWDTYLALSEPGTVAIGIDIMPGILELKNLQLRNVREFIVSVYKYQCVKSIDDVSGTIRDIVQIVKRGEMNVQ